MVYSALDRATDETWKEIKKVFSEIEEFEYKMFKTDCDPESLLALKKRLNHIDYSIGHLASVVSQIQNFYHPRDDLRWRLRDLHDHCERIYQNVAYYRSQIATSIELYWGLQANKTNRQIKKLSMLASMAIPVTFWASFWGMNFEAIPFSDSRLFIAAVIVMLISVVGTTFFLIKKGYWRD